MRGSSAPAMATTLACDAKASLDAVRTARIVHDAQHAQAARTELTASLAHVLVTLRQQQEQVGWLGETSGAHDEAGDARALLWRRDGAASVSWAGQRDFWWAWWAVQVETGSGVCERGGDWAADVE
jgi:hypothetical protein